MESQGRRPRRNTRPLLVHLDKNPGQHGNEIPRQLRDELRGAEADRLISYDTNAGWSLTDRGTEAVLSVS